MDIATFLAKKAELDTTLKEQGHTMLNKLFTDFFDALPQIKTITWTMYTPYFNDGDTCVFRVNEVNFATRYPEDIEEFSAYGGEEEAGWVNARSNPVLSSFIVQFYAAESVLESLGDHAHVTVTNREEGVRIEVEEYQHD